MSLIKTRQLKMIVLCVITVCLVACNNDKVDDKFSLSDDAVILALGDSLTYGTGAPKTESYPAILENLTGHQVINAGIPGEISQDGLQRLPKLLEEYQPTLVILCHGANDLIRRLDTKALEQNLSNMIDLIRQSGAEVLLVSVPELKFTLNNSPVYASVADKKSVRLEDDIIQIVESDSSLKSDLIHPNAQGYKLIAEEIADWIHYN